MPFVTIMQASPEHLLSAAIMSAPAALAMAKLSYPETEESHTKTQEDVYIENVYAFFVLLSSVCLLLSRGTTETKQNKNLAIANRSRVSCAHNSSRAFP